jgi:hypothetical protein
VTWRGYALLALPCGLALAGPPAPPASTAPTQAATASKAPAADADLLEYLGSVDSDEPGWNEYLEHTNLEKVIHAPPKPAAPTTPGTSP